MHAPLPVARLTQNDIAMAQAASWAGWTAVSKVTYEEN